MEKKILDTRVVAIGKQNFEDMISHNNFYIDKTHFIREWWENEDSVTLITRPRRFGKTLLMSMTEQFFSVEYREKSYLFEGLDIFREDAYRKLQGTYPVIFLNFASVKETHFQGFYRRIQSLISEVYRKNIYLMESGYLDEVEKKQFMRIRSKEAEQEDYSEAIRTLCGYLSRFYGKKAIILLDEYDTPMQEAYLHGYWDGMIAFIRNLFNATFKTNPYMERALLTGITRISRESIFSDLNNLKAVTTTTEKYMDSFGFTEEEVFNALDSRGLGERKEDVRQWYDGFTFGSLKDIYNPWSILNFLDEKKLLPYWANTSSNGLLSRLLQSANKETKQKLEKLLKGGTITESLDEQLVFDQLDENVDAIWSLMLAGGYLKVESVNLLESVYTLSLTNQEVLQTLKKTIRGWFRKSDHYNEFLSALLSCDIEAMNAYLNRVLLQIASFFDSSKNPSGTEPERFYHGLVLGLVVELEGRYRIRSNRESGFGRYDIMMEPVNEKDRAYILEFKVFSPSKEKTLEESADAGLKQIDEKRYREDLLAKGFQESQIQCYAFAFAGKKVLIKGK